MLEEQRKCQWRAEQKYPFWLPTGDYEIDCEDYSETDAAWQNAEAEMQRQAYIAGAESERAKRPDRAALERIAAECEADIPYDDGNETAKLIGKRIREALALEPKAREEAGPALRIDDDGAHIYWADPVEGCWVAFRRVDCVGEEELPERRLSAPEALEEPTGRNWVPKEELDFYVEPLTTEAREAE